MHKKQKLDAGNKARQRLLVVTIASALSSSLAWGNPNGPQVVNGSASFSRSGNLLSVTNSNGAIINWNSFSIGADETTRFNQPSAASSVLNRVIANDPSVLLGTLSSNGKVWLVNPAGIMVGQGARIDVAGFIASTLNVKNEDFLAGRLSFATDTSPGKVENWGQITTPSGGSVYLVAPEVENHGVISAPNGEVILAAGQSVHLIDTGTPGVKVEITGDKGNTTNLGEIVSEAGHIGMAGVLVRNSGTLNASSVVREGGRIFLRANRDLTLGAGSKINADAGQTGNGGEIAAIAGGTANVDGSISARGGSQSGDGGFIETSGAHVAVADGAAISTAAPAGRFGTWLIDPQDFTVGIGGDMAGPALSSSLASGHVSIQSSGGVTAGSGNININDFITWSPDTTLTLTASNDINIGNSIIATGANSGLVLNANAANGSETPSGTGSVNILNSFVGIAGALAVSGANLNVGHATATGFSGIQSGSMVATLSGDINVVGGNAPGTMGNIDTIGVQTLSAGNAIRVQGGTSSAHIISHGGQTITATGDITITAGSTPIGVPGDWSGMNVDGAGPQHITANGVTLTGGTGGTSASSNAAQIAYSGSHILGQTIEAGSNGISLIGGANGANNTARLVAFPGSQSQTIGSASGISLQGGPDGSGNFASMQSWGGQTVSVGAGGLNLTGGSGSLSGNAARVEKYGPIGSQTINVNGGSIVLAGGSSAGMTTTNSGQGSRASIYALNAAQEINFTGGGALSLTGGTVGWRNFAQLYVAGTGTQTITGSPVITLTGGASGGVAGEGNYAYIFAQNGAQNISASAVTLQGGASGTENFAAISQGGGFANQTLTVTGNGMLELWGGSGTLNYALIGNSGVMQAITAGNTSLNAGNSGTRNFAVIQGSAQSIAVHGDLALTGGGADPGDFGSGARIGGQGGASPTPTNLSLTVDGSVALTGGSVPGATGSGIGSSGLSGPQLTNITLSAGGDITLTPGSASGAVIGSYGPAFAGGDISLTSGGNIALNGAGAVGTSIGTAGNLILDASAAGRSIFGDTASVIRANQLTAYSDAGTVLNGANAIASFSATNTGSGGVSLINTTNPNIFNILGITTAGGDINVYNHGEIKTVGTLSAPAGNVYLTSGSPLTIGSGGILAAGNIELEAGNTAAANDNLTLNGPVTTTGRTSTISLSAGDNLVQNANVSTNGGSVTAQALDGSINMAEGTTTSTTRGNITYAAPSGDMTLSVLDAGSGKIDLSAGGSITSATGTTGANLIGSRATITAGGDANLTTQVATLNTSVDGTSTITNVPPSSGDDDSGDEHHRRHHKHHKKHRDSGDKHGDGKGSEHDDR